jgi:acetyltransferase
MLDSLPHWIRLGDTFASLRPVRQDDGTALEAMLLRQSPQSRYFRFHSAVNGLTRQALARMTRIADAQQLALVLVTESPDGPRLIAEARFASDDGVSAEIALMVDEAWHRQGLGRRALAALTDAAVDAGMQSLHGRVLQDNTSMLALARQAGWAVTRAADDGRVMRVRLDLTARPQYGVSGPASPRAAAGHAPNRAAPCAR